MGVALLACISRESTDMVVIGRFDVFNTEIWLEILMVSHNVYNTMQRQVELIPSQYGSGNTTIQENSCFKECDQMY